MIRKQPEIIHFQEYINLRKYCRLHIGAGNSDPCIEAIETYIELYGSDSDEQTFLSLKRESAAIKNENIRGTIDDYNKRRNILSNSIWEFIGLLAPPNFADYEASSLRRKSEWDENDNLRICIQFERDFLYISNIFDSLAKTWKLLIPKEEYFLDENGVKVILTSTFQEDDDETNILGPDSGELVLTEEDFNGDHQHISLGNSEHDNHDEKKEIISEELKDDNAVRFKKKYPKIVEDENEQEQILEAEAEAIVEKSEKRFQIWISAIGASRARCALVNELLNWFETHELFTSGKAEPFTVCIPHAVGFRASEKQPNSIAIEIYQPI